MNPYRALFSTRYRMALQYRLAAIAGAGTQFFWGFVRIAILTAFFRSAAQASPMSHADMVTYVWLGQAMLALLPWTHDLQLEEQIRRGDVAFELVRPVDLYNLWFVRTMGMRTASASLRSIPIVGVAGLALPWLGLSEWALAPPASPGAGAAFLVAMLGAIALGCAITTLVHVSLLWTISGDGLSRLMPAVVTVFSGMVIPLPLFPDWSQALLALLPFRALADVPYRVYAGDIPLAEAWGAIALGFAWTLALVALGRMAIGRGVRQMDVQGG